MVEKKPTLFDFLNQIYYKRMKYPYDKKTASAYMLSLWLSHDKSLINIVHKICKYQFDLPDKVIYDYYFDKVPKGRRYIKWVKKTESEKKKDKDIKNICEKYNVSKRESKMLMAHLERI